MICYLGAERLFAWAVTNSIRTPYWLLLAGASLNVVPVRPLRTAALAAEGATPTPVFPPNPRQRVLWFTRCAPSATRHSSNFIGEPRSSLTGIWWPVRMKFAFVEDFLGCATRRGPAAEVGIAIHEINLVPN